MPVAAPNPLARFLESSAHRATPLPLVATAIDVAVHGGLAVVTTERRFRNTEAISIEAAMTFPVPIDATLCGLSARIDGRTLIAVAKAKDAARAAYEDALAEGKSAVLHEEPLRGIHVLSVGHIAPDAEITVIDTWTAPLSFAGSDPELRIPTTVGEIYGCSPLPPSDDLLVAGPARAATVRVTCEPGRPDIRWASRLADGSWSMLLDKPIEILIAGWQGRRLDGISAAGRAVTLDIAPTPAADGALDVDILFDRSGSMNEPAGGTSRHPFSKFEIAKATLCAATRKLRPDDKVRVWEFNDEVRLIGEATGPQAEALALRIADADGGTEIGTAIDAVLRRSARNDILIMTDGASWALDPQALAATGLRLTAVLVGEQALEAGIAHLASLTGGQAFIASGSETPRALAAALSAVRTPFDAAPRKVKRLGRISTLRRGAAIVATWGRKSGAKPSALARQVGATAAALALPFMNETAATKLAVAECLVTHLTSLVLVDEVAGATRGVPARRRVPLALADPDPVAFADIEPLELACDGPLAAPPASSSVVLRDMGGLAAVSTAANAFTMEEIKTISLWIVLKHIATRIDWDDDPDALCRGELRGAQSGLVVLEIGRVARLPHVAELAASLGVKPMIAVLGLAARSVAAASRSAERVARAILGAADEDRLTKLIAEPAS